MSSPNDIFISLGADNPNDILVFDPLTGPATATTPMMVVTPSTWHLAPTIHQINQAAIEAETDDCLVIAMAAHYLLTR